MNIFKYIPVIVFIGSIPFFHKAVALYNVIKSVNRDGDGIGLYFLGMEINDKLRYEQIPLYLWTFLIIGLLLVACSIIIRIKARKLEA